MNKKILTLLASVSLAFFMSACGDDNSSSVGVDCLDNENCLEEPDSSDSDDAESSSSVKGKSSSSSKAKSSSSEKASSSSSKKDDKSSSSGKEDKSSSSQKDDKSSSSEAKSSSSEAKSSSSEEVSSSSEAEPESSSSSVELKITYLAETPYAADLEVSGDTLFAVFQRYEVATDGYTSIFNEPGLLAMFKLSDGTLLDTITLVTKNPMAVTVVKGNVYVGTQGEYNPVTWGIDADDNRGIEKVDLKNKKSELWVGGSQLGGGVYMMDVDKASGKAYVAVYRAYQDVPAVEVDLASKSVKTIDGIVDASGSIFYDSKAKLAYIVDRGSIDYNTFEMTPMVAYA